ncbi:MAG: hypothetical protein IPM82_22480 [Saprospiraceae bacterium]|nr:hypothetical protein [Saprospiraceae bacterium]
MKKIYQMDLMSTKLELIKLIADVQSESLLEQVKQFFRQKEKELAAALLPSPKKGGGAKKWDRPSLRVG